MTPQLRGLPCRKLLQLGQQRQTKKPLLERHDGGPQSVTPSSALGQVQVVEPGAQMEATETAKIFRLHSTINSADAAGAHMP